MKHLDIIGAYDTTRHAVIAILQKQSLDAVNKFKLLNEELVIGIYIFLNSTCVI